MLITKDQSSKVSAFFNILTGYLLINLSSSSSKECTMSIALKVATGEILQNLKKSPTHVCFTTSKECSGQISQKSAEFCYLINSFVCRNDAWSFSWSLLQFSFVKLKKLAIHIFSRNLHLLSFPTIYSLPCFPLKWRAYEFFPEDMGRHSRRSRVTLTCRILVLLAVRNCFPQKNTSAILFL